MSVYVSKRKESKNNKETGITLIALVITIIVLLILAGVTISTLTGENGLLNKAITAKEQTERAVAEEDLILVHTNELTKNYNNVNLKNVVSEMENKGYTIIEKTTPTITEIEDIEDIVVAPGKQEERIVKLKQNASVYYIKLDDKFYSILQDSNSVSISNEALENIEDTGSQEVKISVELSDENYAEVSFDDANNTITVEGIKEGDIILTINVAIGENIITKTVKVSVSDITLNYSWQELAEVSKAISNDNNITALSESATEIINGKTYKIEIGDTAKVTYTNIAGETNTYKVRVLGFNQDILAETYDGYGANAGISFEFVDIIENLAINSEATSANGWVKKDIYSTMNGSDGIYNKMQGLSGVIKKVMKTYIKNFGSGETDTSNDYLWLLACSEIWRGELGETGYVKVSEGEQYAYYRNKINNLSHSEPTIELYKMEKNSTNATSWWLRSPDSNFYSRFYAVSYGGKNIATAATSSYGIAPGFSI